MVPQRSLALAAALLLSAACAAPAEWQQIETGSKFESIWREFIAVGERNGFSIDRTESDSGKRIYVSKWRAQPAPFRLGKRTRLHGRFERTEAQDGWVVEYHVENQRVDDIAAGFQPDEEDWKAAGQDRQREEIIGGQLRLAFDQPLGVEPTFRRGR